jgi:N-acetylglucosamine-6-phosphate deacetylase
VVVALSPGGLAFDVREVRDLAGKVRAFGMTSVQALQTVTLNPAKILGVDDQLGSIEKGKLASFVLCEGDLMDVTPVVSRAWGEGREIRLDDRQKELYRKYQLRLREKSGLR